jgi:hypothetical protein
VTRLALLLALSALAGAIAALFWAFVKVGGDFRVKPLPVVEGDFGEAGW